MIEKILQRNLKSLRNKAKLTQSQAAENAGISLRYYQRIEAGESWPPPETIKSLARALHIDELAFFSEEREEQKENSRAVLLVRIIEALATLDDTKLEVIVDVIDADVGAATTATANNRVSGRG